MSTSLSGRLVTPQGMFTGHIDFTDKIQGLRAENLSGAQPFILPGFIDAHVHGGGGGDAMDGAAGLEKMARLHAWHGTTTLLPTTITNPWEEVLRALRAIRKAIEQPIAGGADIAGAHLEGPFISPQRLGAQPPYAILPAPERLKEVLDIGAVKAITLAPEITGAREAALELAKRGVRVGIGHTRADGETVASLLRELRAAGGESSATHLFNAMGGIEGRHPGPAAALLSDPHAWIEVIYDTIHVHPLSFKLACAAAPERIMLISDSMRAAGLPDGESELGGQRVWVREGRATLENGTLAGSVLTLDVALRHALDAGLPLETVSRMLSLYPARSLRLSDRGELQSGLRADITVLNPDYTVSAVYVAGQQVR